MATLKKNSVVVTQPMRRVMIGSSPLKSPHIKRPPSAPVTLQGWLYKQGSEGLMLWKKRWFVLSEFCLFYYKNDEEEKLLGSILLPSYKISPCCPSEDKVYRKFSFKAEHDNMRTYYFAADTRELMVQWMNALSLASILQQTNGYSERINAKRSEYVNQIDDMDSGFLSSSFYSTPRSYYNNDLSFKSHNVQIAQPLYANAPPKPRRVTDCLEEHPQIAQPQYKHLPLVQNLNRSQLNNNSERRTPDTYGRHDVEYSIPSEYEEVIDEYTPNSVKYREKKYSYRPHSADFLEYDAKRAYQTPTPSTTSYKSPEYYNTSKQNKRPKSSLDFIDNSDSYWSENAYAEKMRQASQSLNKETNLNRTSALSLRQLGIYLNDIKAEPVEVSSAQTKNHRNYIKEQEKRWSEYVNSFNRSASARAPRNAERRNYEQNEHKRSTSLQRRNSIDSRDKERKSQQREESMKRLLDWKQRMLQSTLTRKSSGSSNRGSAQNELSKYYKKITDNRLSVKNEEKNHSNNIANTYYNNTKYNNDNLDYMKNDLPVENGYDFSDDEEAKERETQAENSTTSTTKSFHEITPDSKYTNTINFYTKPAVKQQQHLSDETASSTNSYFKDDTLVVDSRHSDSGYDTLQMGSSVLSSKDPDIDRLLKFDFGKKNGIRNLIQNFESKEMKEPLQSSSYRTNEAQISSLKKEDVRYSTAQNPQSVRDLLANFEKKKERCVFSDTETLLYETSSDTEPSIPRLKHNEVLSTDEDDPEVADVLGQKADPNDEQYYLPMTPSKKSVLEEEISKSKLVMINNEDQENYVEMTQNAKPILAPSPKFDKKSHYEYIAYKTNSNYEPVYTEVKAKILPDILKSSTNVNNSSIKSDSSDADDEASKDLDSLDTPCHPRFSLSDTFRPASYYLGAANNEDTHDSSDSDLVSPPPMNFDKDNELKSIRKKMESLIQSASESDSDSSKKEKQPIFSGDLDSIGSRNGMYNIDINLDDYLDKQNIEECDRFYENYCKSLETRRLEGTEPPLGAPYYYSDISNGNLRSLTPEPQGAEGFSMRQRSRSLEGVLDESSVYCNLEPRKCTSPKEAISRLLRTAEMKSPRTTDLTIVNLPLRSRSLDNLDAEPEKKSGRQSADILNDKKNEAMYVNEAAFDRHKEYKDDYRSVKKGRCKSGSQSFLEEGLYPMTRPPSMEQLDREKLRQWDLMSTVPAVMLGATRAYSRTSEKQATLTPAELNTRPPSLSRHSDETPTSSPVSGCGSAIGQGPVHREYQEINKIINETMGSKNIYSSNRNIRNSQWNLTVSAGELLGQTHEELVLLLIQLRRQRVSICKAMEMCHDDIEAQTRLIELDTPTKMENLQRLDDLKNHLLDLEKQYEKGKPLVNLVDNMVKLGSLYQAGSALENPYGLSTPTILKERLEFNDKVQEKRLLEEESKEWLRIKPNINDLQEKVDRLYDLDQLMQEESGNLQHLRQDKELLEKALGGLRHKMQGTHNPADEERYRRQQHVLERELSAVRSVLANNSKKLEETVAANARLESELVVLRQKLQSSRRIHDTGAGGPTVAALEAELRRVQLLVGDLQRQRENLSVQVRQLTEKSNTLTMQMNSGESEIKGKKRPANDSWVETDLDDSMQEDNIKFYTPREKPQEIKTVRIVKRESERRQRDKCSGNIGLPLTSVTVKCVPVIEEADYRADENYAKKLSAQEQLFGPMTNNNSYSMYSNLNFEDISAILPNDDAPLSPVYQSEAARQIVEELSKKDRNENIKTCINEQLTKRLIPREKRRHHTVTSVRPLPIADTYNRDGWRSRDDVDMERALRPGAPDVVRSTMNKTEPTRFNAETIDSIIGTPGKICIPERYIPESAPVSPDERKKRMHKAEAIRKMLSESTPILSSEGEIDEHTVFGRKKMMEEKKQRDHLLQLNQILAQQVMEKSKAVALNAMAQKTRSERCLNDSEDRELSPEEPLPLYQQRENYYS
ncbi:uncharacterized protein LOC126841310 isoform X2 [Adelges cooleyi]|nr:uncharacterized protein LOC126841310 isoform X2 [Adelges cooleyi]XP_050433658.1 uncharacterized protein LOC126841310 isoform X2 [Adelges cooleyi]XP_050433659.1 uncharacterized protein LOC126841310 isoform X2 [Adelges cooleyi]